jgi:hypothetical protein
MARKLNEKSGSLPLSLSYKFAAGTVTAHSLLKLKTLSLMLFLHQRSGAEGRGDSMALREAADATAGNNRRNNKEAI